MTKEAEVAKRDTSAEERHNHRGKHRARERLNMIAQLQCNRMRV